MPTIVDPRREVRMRRMHGFVQIVAVVAGVMFFVVGAWAFLAPRAFFEQLAVFEPYSRHFVRDIGAFQIGLGTVLLIAAVLRAHCSWPYRV